MGLKMNWLALEAAIRADLRVAAKYVSNPEATQHDLALLLVSISETIGRETGRGYEIDPTTPQGAAFLARFPEGGN